jgi:hypothetical protein
MIKILKLNHLKYYSQLLCYLSQWNRVLLERPTGSKLVKKFPTFYWTIRFITTFKWAHHLSPSWARSIQSMLPHLTSWQPSLILFSHLYLGLPSGLLPHQNFCIHTNSLMFSPWVLLVTYWKFFLPKSLKFQNVIKVMCSHIIGFMLCLQYPF